MLEIKRLFVGNIPPGITESDLEKEFSAYGEVQKAEIKKKENLVDPENPNLFAFVNINIDEKALNLCIDEFSKLKYRGRYLSVSVAKESFLDRLKREREENAQKTKNHVPSVNETTSTTKVSAQPLPKLRAKEQSSTESDSTESDEENAVEDEEPPSREVPQKSEPQLNDDDTIFIAKKRASASVLNGKIKIQSINSDPIHIVTKKVKNLKRLDEKAKKSDDKRKESLNKMKNQYNLQKQTIQQALSAIDSNKSKKIVFEDEEMINGEEIPGKNVTKKNLFNDDEEEDGSNNNNYDKDFEIKPQFLGKGGEKLMELQSKFKLDPRFKLDKRFLENGAEDGKTEETDERDDERNWQLGIIEQVVGRKFETLSEPHKMKLRKAMLRFDPNKKEHQKFLRNVEKVAETFTETEKQPKKEEMKVSGDQFYSVNEDLSKSLKRRGDGFSLLSMFGRAEDETENQQKNTEKYREKPLLFNKGGKSNLDNPFKFDSSESEDEDIETVNEVPSRKPIAMQIGETDRKTTTPGIRKESFFIFSGDERLKEGAAFFRRPQRKEGEEPEDYEKVKNTLSLVIKKKIKKTREHKEKLKKRKFKQKNFKTFK